MNRYALVRLPKTAVCLLTLLGFVTTSKAQAQGAPDSLSFQGFVTDPGGVPIDNPSVSITFKLYRDGASIWEETHPTVAVDSGLFNVLLGGTTALDTVAFNAPLELGITLDGDSEISPRTPLAAAAYAKALPGLYTYRTRTSSNSSRAVIGGAPNNAVTNFAMGPTISGGGGILGFNPVPNTVAQDWTTIGGGYSNTASGLRATVGGGAINTASGTSSTIAGGLENSVSGGGSTVSGGTNNTAGPGGDATVGGGQDNTASGGSSTISGGNANTASGTYATIGGGDTNTASASSTTVGGGYFNTASGAYSVVPGGVDNRASGGMSFAAGRRAKADHGGSFVWADSSGNADFESTGVDQFLIRAAGGVGIGTNAPGHPLEMASGAHVTAGGMWTDASSKELKEAFEPVQYGEILDQLAGLDVTRWRYKNTGDAGTHMAPVAEDFHAVFGLGADNTHIAALDASGVALAAIKALQGLVEVQAARLESQARQIESQQARIAALEQAMGN